MVYISCVIYYVGNQTISKMYHRQLEQQKEMLTADCVICH